MVIEVENELIEIFDVEKIFNEILLLNVDVSVDVVEGFIIEGKEDKIIFIVDDFVVVRN